MIEINQLSKKYKNSEEFAVYKLDLKIKEGEIFGLLGPNGAGKTTLISMLTSLLKPTLGTFSIHGFNFKDHKNTLKQMIGVVPQEYALYPTLTAFENLHFFGSMYGLKGQVLKKDITDHLEIMGLSKFTHRRIDAFSGGMKRRINLIASILHKPKVLFLDEPTVGVDVQSKNVLINHLKKLNENGMTIIYTSHHLIEAETFCSQVAIIDRGEIVIQGRPGELVSMTEGSTNLEDVFITLTGKELRDHA